MPVGPYVTELMQTMLCPVIGPVTIYTCIRDPVNLASKVGNGMGAGLPDLPDRKKPVNEMTQPGTNGTRKKRYHRYRNMSDEST